jgi:endonuclease/exonuclease/phosphatase family metal-dependent hydrolase
MAGGKKTEKGHLCEEQDDQRGGLTGSKQSPEMKKIILLSVALAGIFQTMELCGQEMNVMSFNIRYNNPQDSLNAWPLRKDKVVSQVLFHQTHILAVQEALHDQVVDLEKELKKYRYTGSGRDDGKTKGEYAAIFFDTTMLDLLQSSQFWLSLTPGIPASKSWDAAITRIVTWAKFRYKISGKAFFVFNTHFDHRGNMARKESAVLLKQKVKGIAGDIPSVITGDFNSKPFEDPILLLTSPGDKERFTDSKEISQTPHYGPTGTFNAFQSKETDAWPIDYIFLKGDWIVRQHATLSQTWEGRFSSDHFPVFATIILK